MQQMNFLLQILLLAQHVSGTIIPIIRSSRVLYKWLRFAALKQQPANRTHNPQLHTTPTTLNPSTKYDKQKPLVKYSRAPDDGNNGARSMLSEQ
jgi:hypothetical protein